MTKALPPHRAPRHGFTLVELSIALVIIGLLAGGALVAQDLIRGGQMRAVEGDLSKYETAVITFRDKYQSFPGDFTGATAIWGSVGGNGSDASCQNTPAVGLLTCNGNGDGFIATSAVALDESYRAWQHLANAGFVEGLFTGSSAGLSAATMVGTAVPASRMNNIGYQFITANKTTDEGWSNVPEGNALVPAIRVAAPYPGADAPLRLGDYSMSPFDIGTLDEKIDDGKPGTGKVYVQANWENGCLTSHDATTATYIMTNEKIGCFLHYTY